MVLIFILIFIYNHQRVDSQVVFNPVYFKDKILRNILRVRIPATVGHGKVKNFIIQRMKQLGFSVDLDEFEDSTPFYKRLAFTNIIATHNIRAKQRLVFACHYDSKYFDPQLGKVFVGAIDSAVSCAMLIYISEMLLPYLAKDKDATLQLIFFDGEEAFNEWSDTDSLYGSRHLAKKFAQTYLLHSQEITELSSIKLLVLLDLIGYKHPKFFSLYQNTDKYFQMLAKIERKQYPNEKEYFFQVSDGYQSWFGNTIGDDHVPFVNAGVKCLHLIPIEFPPPWHTFDDTEKIVDYESVRKLQLILFEFIKTYLNI